MRCYRKTRWTFWPSLYNVVLVSGVQQHESVICCSVTKLCPFANPASLSITISPSLLKLMSVELVILSKHLILCCPLLLLPSIFPSIKVFSNESTLPIRWPGGIGTSASASVLLPTKVRLVRAMVFPVVMYGCELDYKESWAVKNRCFWTVVLEKTLESPLDRKEIQINPS